VSDEGVSRVHVVSVAQSECESSKRECRGGSASKEVTREYRGVDIVAEVPHKQKVVSLSSVVICVFSRVSPVFFGVSSPVTHWSGARPECCSRVIVWGEGCALAT